MQITSSTPLPPKNLVSEEKSNFVFQQSNDWMLTFRNDKSSGALCVLIQTFFVTFF